MKKTRRADRAGWSSIATGQIGCVAAVLLGVVAGDSWAATVVLKNGMQLTGEVARLASMVTGPNAGAPGNETIVFVDDGLRRTYVSLSQVKQVIDNAGVREQKITVPQPVGEGPRRIASLGHYVEPPTELDQWGRRRIKIRLSDGVADIVQGVTLVTPRYVRLQTLGIGPRLDQRYATSNLSSATLARIMDYAMRDAKPDARLAVAQLYLQAERYLDAQHELESLSKRQPKIDGIQDMLQELRQLQARTVLSELKLRRESGQHELVRRNLKDFPRERVAGETLFQVRELLTQYVQAEEQIAQLKADLKQRLGEVKDTDTRRQLAPLVDEMAAELNLTNVERLSAFRRLSGDAAMRPSEKLALAISGWLVGTDEATNSLSSALSLLAVRGYIREYFHEPIKTRRERIAENVRSQEAGTPRLVARLLAAMKPPYPLPDPTVAGSGLYELSVPGRDKQPDATYLVQLPPEYDSYRRYPVVLTLHGEATDGRKQIDWWAGGVDKQGQRRGQAGRHGYIVLAPQWARPGQQEFQYSAREHDLVLDVLRDACRRFSIDTDRVFLSGHAMGGDAAWDLGLAHPDLWAGVIPIVATADTGKYRYCQLYWQNGRHVPLYFIGGESDGQKMAKNATLFDRYLQYARFDATVVEYQGRGHESFSDEILQVFEWMRRQKRKFFPKEFDCVTLRSFDNYFWWIEINKFLPGVVVDPDQWPGRGIRTLKVSGSIRTTDKVTTVRASTGRGSTTIWLSPELVDFSQRIRVEVSGRAGVNGPKPDVGVMLEDARSRGDRQHPFWARVDLP